MLSGSFNPVHTSHVACFEVRLPSSNHFPPTQLLAVGEGASRRARLWGYRRFHLSELRFLCRGQAGHRSDEAESPQPDVPPRRCVLSLRDTSSLMALQSRSRRGSTWRRGATRAAAARAHSSSTRSQSTRARATSRTKSSSWSSAGRITRPSISCGLTARTSVSAAHPTPRWWSRACAATPPTCTRTSSLSRTAQVRSPLLSILSRSLSRR